MTIRTLWRVLVAEVAVASAAGGDLQSLTDFRLQPTTPLQLAVRVP